MTPFSISAWYISKNKGINLTYHIYNDFSQVLKRNYFQKEYFSFFENTIICSIYVCNILAKVVYLNHGGDSMLRKNKHGFTLIEIIIVVVILAVLMAVAVPTVLKYIDTAQEAPALTECYAYVTASQKRVIDKYAQNKSDNIHLNNDDKIWIDDFVDVENGEIQGNIRIMKLQDYYIKQVMEYMFFLIRLRTLNIQLYLRMKLIILFMIL